MKSVNTKFRSSEAEIMDKFDFNGEKLENTLKDLERVNRFLGGNKVTLNGLEKFILKGKEVVHIADIGCGSGQTLREIAKWGRKRNLKLQLIGIDANPYTIEIAEKLSMDFPEISYQTQDIFNGKFPEYQYDIVCICLTLHHFSTEKIKELLLKLSRNTDLGIIINDLQRSRVAYYLFQLFCLVFVRSKIAKKDGLISILRGFKRTELKAISEELQFKKIKITWCWAFRYQWIIKMSHNN
ncbi:MAG TPA: methyltransferase domain-containing protein [Flavobacteriaceae bacterium]|nr:methyltransferase domain-containing protein [Flavobacteriaceae bacterium]